MTDTLGFIKTNKLIAISRGSYGEPLINAALALYRGGVRVIEVTFEHDKPRKTTARAISELIAALPADAAVGAGTVLDAEDVQAACDAGASFIISPNTDADVIRQTKLLSMVSIPGAMTPTEIVSAYELGADIVKLFPAGILGVEYFNAVRAPVPHIPLAAVAGITAENIGLFARAGAAAFGVSSSLFNKKSILCGDFASIEEAARSMIKAMNE